MVQRGYCMSKYDSCVYLRELPSVSFIYLLLYVDDTLIATKDKSDIQNLKTQLSINLR